MKIGFRVDSVDITTIWIDGREVVSPFLITHVHSSLISEQHRITSVTSRHNTIEHIDTSFDSLEDVLRRTHTHQVARTVLRQNLVNYLYHLVHHLSGLPNSQTTYRGTTSIVQLAQRINDMLSSILTQVFIGTALHNREQRLIIPIEWFCFIESLDTTFQPSLSQPQ